MADEQGELRHVNWKEVFGFTLIFKSFRMAIQPSKMLLALAMVLVLVLSGWVMDRLWLSWDGTARDNEISNYARRSSVDFAHWKEEWQEGRLANAASLLAEAKEQRHTLNAYTAAMAEMRYFSRHMVGAFQQSLVEYNAESEADYKRPDVGQIIREAGRAKDDWSDLLESAQDEFADEMGKVRTILSDSYDLARDRIRKDESLTDDETRDQAESDLDGQYRMAKRAITLRRFQFEKALDEIRGKPIFASFLHYEWDSIRKAISAASYGNIFSGLKDYRQIQLARQIQPIADVRPFRPAAPRDDTPGALYWLLMCVSGVVWLIAEHWVFAVIYLAITLVGVALFGGAVHRIAALHACRDEKISVFQALKFSAGKLPSFITAPLIPLAIVLVLGVLLAAGGLLGNIPVIGPIVMAVLFFLALLAGLAIAFLVIGLVAGGPLMYPTIAVEGSDSFDAISRSFSYVFARPFRAAIYGLVALIYGVITYLFVRLFVFIALSATHMFVKWGIFVGGERLAEGADRLDVLWTAPEFQALWGRFSWAAMSGPEKLAAVIIALWVFPIAAGVVAYLLSYAASSTTCVYLLLRRKVDATDLDDIYVEEPIEEPLPEAAPAEAPAEEAPAAEEGEAEEDTGKGKKKK